MPWRVHRNIYYRERWKAAQRLKVDVPWDVDKGSGFETKGHVTEDSESSCWS